MSDLLAARSQMAMSLAFHIVFAVAGMGMPLLLALSEWRWLRSLKSALMACGCPFPLRLKLLGSILLA